MPLYMDTHKNMDGLTQAALAEAHQQDLAVQAKHGVKFVNYWYNEAEGTVFCLCEAPNVDAAKAVHQAAHGNCADEVIEVKRGG